MRPSHLLLAAAATFSLALSPDLLAQSRQMPNVKSIEIQYVGPETVSKERILANMRTAVGRPYSDAAVEEDIRNLYGTGRISNVRIFLGEQTDDGIEVIVVVQTRGSVKEVRLEGVTQVKTKSLRKQLLTKPDGQLTEASLEADRQKILSYYRERGYKDTAVESQIAPGKGAEGAVVTFTVTEGGKTVVQHIRFEGNTIFSDRQLRKVIKTNTHTFLSFLTKSGRLQNDKLQDDVAALLEHYQNSGYLDAAVAQPQIERTSGKPDVNLVFTIREGEQYKVGTMGVTGTEVLTAEEVTAKLQLKPGAVYSPLGLETDIRAIQDLYGARGYIDAQVVPETTAGGTHLQNVVYHVTENVQSYVNRINISGNTRSKDKVIRRELALAPGELYNTARVDASKSRLTNLNYFERVDLFPSDTMIPGRKDLNVVVTEKRTGSLNFGAGFSSIDSLIGFVELTQSNFDITNWPTFTGGGQRFRTRLQYGDRRRDFVVSLTEPYFLDYELAVGGELFYHDATFLSSVYDQKNYGLNLFTRKAINPFWSWRLDYRLENITLYNMAEGVSREIESQRGDHLKSQLSPSLTYDTRDSVFLTRRGTRADLTTYVAGGPLGGDVKIYGFDLEASHYILLPWDTILTLNGEVAVVDSWKGGDGNNGENGVPIFDRLYLGGANNLRGFDFRDVSPRDENGEPIGGNSMARVTLEYTFPVVDRVRGALFYDAGMVNGGSYDFDFSNVASDVGIGVRLDLPIGPVRIDYGIPVQNAYETGNGGRFNFNIGYQF